MAPGAREATHSRKRVRRSKGASTNFAGADHLRPASRAGCPTLSRRLPQPVTPGAPPSRAFCERVGCSRPVIPSVLATTKTPRRHAPSNPVILTNRVILSAAEESQYFACATTEPQAHPNHLVARVPHPLATRKGGVLSPTPAEHHHLHPVILSLSVAEG